jgi:hypothetical protein
VAGLRGRRVTDIMERDYPTVEGHFSLQDFVNGRVEGVLSRSHVLRYLQTHAELQRR